MTDTVIDFASAGKKHKHQRVHSEKDVKMAEIQARFSAALPDKKTPVKDYLKKKRAAKKR